jgi:hypothetical protein
MNVTFEKQSCAGNGGSVRTLSRDRNSFRRSGRFRRNEGTGRPCVGRKGTVVSCSPTEQCICVSAATLDRRDVLPYTPCSAWSIVKLLFYERATASPAVKTSLFRSPCI